MMKACKCGSYAINHHCHGRDGSDDDLCDVCYWRKRAEQPAQPQQVPVAWMYDRARYGPTDLRGQQWLPELSMLKPYTGNGMVRGLIPLYTHPQACELEQVEKDLRFHGLTLVKTATGYAVLKLGHITAHGIKENT